MSGIATSVIPLLSLWENYIQQHPEGDIPGFAHWILAQQPAGTSTPDQQPTPTSYTNPTLTPSTPAPSTQLPATAMGGLLIARNNRIIRLLSKPIIKSLGFTKDMEFGALVHVAIMNHPNKKELCRELLIENSTGVEITRRLAKKGVIAEEPDPKDRRSALLSITEKGKKLLLQGSDRFNAFHSSFFNALTPEETDQLVQLLRRVNEYHSSRINNQPELLE
jgi:DNA-binding MarR family transcriptional regulator